ncbi:MAG: hypothetical protein DKT66_06505 [Candidatus Melainabacteria bacterium]|nr:MAG: hypothetical protein DKT66_06505 [Candidatus Melainabacteria bacterium]
MSNSLTALKPEYDQLFSTCKVKAGKVAAVQKEANLLIKNKGRYVSVSNMTNVPWYVIGILHGLESSYSFVKHLHNGDPLSARTVRQPAGRPIKWNPPSTWESSATDAVLFKNFDKWSDWTVAGLLFKFESYNGFGYRAASVNIKSPYLWSFSTHYSAGKYASDGVFDRNLVSQQCGAAVLLAALSELGAVSIQESPTMSKEDALIKIMSLGQTVKYSTSVFSDAAASLQHALNVYLSGALEVDGYPGRNTSDEYKRVSKRWLSGDPRN